LAGIFRELRRRSVFRVAAVYLAVAWLLAQVVAVVKEPLHLPNWFDTVVIVFLALGFPIALVCAWAFELTPDGLKRTEDADHAPQAPASLGRKIDFVIIGALVVALVLALWDRNAPSDEAASTVAEQIGSANSVRSVAVLPFANVSSDPEQEYFSDGLSEEVLNDLARIEGLKVPARTSSFAFKDSTEGVQAIAAKLGVGHILEGSVRKSGNRLRITAQLIDAANGYNMWSKTYDKELNDVFAIQEEIAESVANALSITLGIGDRARIKSGTENVDAYNAFLTGRALINDLGPDQTLMAAKEFIRATELDPNFAEAWAALGDSYIQRMFVFSSDYDEMLGKAEDAAHRALSLSPDLASGHYVMAYVYSLRANWELADKEFATARSIRSEWNTYFGSAVLEMAVGRNERARDYWLRAREAEPRLAYFAGVLSLTYDILGLPDLADKEYAASQGLAGDRRWLEQYRLGAIMGRGTPDQIKAQAHRLAAATDAISAGERRVVDELDHGTLTLDAIRAWRDEAPERIHDDIVIGLWAAYLGDDEMAFDQIRQALTTNPVLGFNVWLPVMKGMRNEPGFEPLLEQLGLVDYWRKTGWPELCRPVGVDGFECD
jgi:TolB-like protein